MYRTLLTIFILIVASATTSAKTKTCGHKFVLPETTKDRTQIVDLAPGKSVELSQYLFFTSAKKAQIATNVVCQKVSGISYTGQPEEWKKFFDSALTGFVNTGYQHLSFTLVGENEAVLKNNNLAKEYIFRGTKEGNEQIIYNVAMLSTDYSSMLTISVSGNVIASEEIKNEFIKITSTVSFPKVATK